MTQCADRIPVRIGRARQAGIYIRGLAAKRPAVSTPIHRVLGTYKRMEPPRIEDDFDMLCSVRIHAAGEFVVREWVEGG